MLGMKGRSCGALEKEIELVVRVKMVIVKAAVVFDDYVLRLICGHAPQGVSFMFKKTSFYDELKGEWDMHGVDELVVCLGDINGHVGRHIDGHDVAHGQYVVVVVCSPHQSPRSPLMGDMM